MAKQKAVLTLMDTMDGWGRDITGYISGRLTILGLYGKKIYPSKAQVYMWRARCGCGSDKIVNGQHFVEGRIKSCGCLGRDRASESKKGVCNRRVHKGIYPEPVRLSPQDLWARKGSHPDFKGRTFGKLKVLSLEYAILYWNTAAKSRRVTPGKVRKAALHKRIVSHWICRCSCGSLVEKSSTYFYKKGAYFACHKCIRLRDRNQPVIARSPEPGAP